MPDNTGERCCINGAVQHHGIFCDALQSRKEGKMKKIAVIAHGLEFYECYGLVYYRCKYRVVNNIEEVTDRS